MNHNAHRRLGSVFKVRSTPSTPDATIRLASQRSLSAFRRRDQNESKSNDAHIALPCPTSSSRVPIRINGSDRSKCHINTPLRRTLRVLLRLRIVVHRERVMPLSPAGAPFVPPTLSYQVPRRHPRHRDCLLGAREVGASHSRFRRHPPSPAPGLRGVAASSASHGYFSMSTTPFVVPAGVSLKIAQAVRGVITRVLRCGYVLELCADAGWPYLVDHRSIAGIQSGF